MQKFLLGLFVGVMAAGAAVWVLMPSLMLEVHESKLGFDETVTAIEKAYKDNDWKVPHTYNIQKTLQNNGYPDMTPIKILSVCQPDDAHKILRDDANKMVTAVMPCRIGVYQTEDGKTHVSVMNIGLMGKMFGGTIAEVMAEVAQKEQEIMQPIYVN